MGVIIIKLQYIVFIAACYGDNANKLCCVYCYHFLVGFAYNFNCESSIEFIGAKMVDFITRVYFISSDSQCDRI